MASIRNKATKKILLIIAILLAILGMVDFRSQHSAKERLREAGIRYYRMARYDDAADCFSQALKQQEAFTSKSDQDIYYYLADGEMKQENYKSAITYYEKLIELGASSMDLYANLGICYEQEDKLELAYRYYQQALEYDEENSDLYYYLCEICLKQNLTDACMEYAKQGYQYIKGQLSKSVQELVANGTAQSVTTGQRKELTKCGQLAYLSGNYDDAYTYYSILYSAGEDEAALYMGHCLAEAGQYEQALELFDNYESKHGEQPLSVAKKAYCKMQLEQYDEALELVDRALAMEGQQLGKELLYEKGVALEQTGDFDSAFDCFAEYVEQYPEDEEAQREYDFLVTRLSDEKAEAVGVDNGN